MAFGPLIPNVPLTRCLLAITMSLAIASVALGQDKQTYLPVQMQTPRGASNATVVGRMDQSAPLHLAVSLPYRDPAGIRSFVDSVSDPKSSSYRHFLTPAEIGKRFGPLPSTIAKVRSYLAQNGMTIRLVGDNGLSILADATVRQAETAFHTQLFKFASADGYVPRSGPLFSFVDPPSVPQEIQPFVLNISGLESFSHPRPANSYCTPNQIQAAYNLTPMYNNGTQGQGRTIAISSWDGYRISNEAFELSEFGLPAPGGGAGSNITVKAIDGGSGTGEEQGEGDLDIQSIIGVAPLCNLVIYDGAGDDLINVLTEEANDNIADVISESYGWYIDSSTMSAAHDLHLSMAAEGITYMAATGDYGTSIDYYYPDIDPEVLLVGGTTLNLTSGGARSSELGWSGSGGGWVPTGDSFNTLPSYQKGTGVPTSINYRLIPDVALNADPNTGYVVYIDGGFYIIGGTSGASPTFAGSLGDSEQQLIANGTLTETGGVYRFGRIQDLLYSLNGNSSVFNDITSGSNGTLPNGQTSQCGVGWDTVTGWGSLNFNGFVTSFTSGPISSFSLSPASVLGGGKSTATIKLSSAAPTGGTTVTISGGDSSISYPSSVKVSAGSKSATFSVTTQAVSSNDTETLTATIGSATANATLTVTSAAMSSVAFSPTSGAGGVSFKGTVTLTGAAGPSGDVVSLSGGDSSISYPSTVTVASGAKTATFTVTSSAVTSNDTETIAGTLGASTKSATITLDVVNVSTLTFSPSSVSGGTTVTGTVTLSVAAPPSGQVVNLSGGDSAVSYPATVTVASGAKTATFKVTTSPVNGSSSDGETLQAAVGSSNPVSGSFTIKVPVISSFVFSPSSIYGGVTASATITLSGPAGSSGVSISLSGGDSSITLPSTASVTSGSKSVTFNVPTSIVTAMDAETVTAQLNGANTNASLTLKPEGIVSAVTFSPSSVVGGVNSTGTVKLTYAAGPTGVTVSLSGGDGSISYPSTVSIASGASSATFTVTTSAVTANDSETVTGTLGPSSAHGSLTVTASTLASLAFSPGSVVGGTSSTGTVTLTGVAPTNGLVVNLSGGDSYVGYPSSVTVPAGSKTVQFTITTSAVTSTKSEKITATLGSITKSATLTVKT